MLVMVCAALPLRGQEGVWTGKLEVSGTELALVFNLSDEGATLDVPDQGAKGIAVEVSRDAVGGIELNISDDKRFIQGDLSREDDCRDFHPAWDVVSDDAYAGRSGVQAATDSGRAVPLHYRGGVVLQWGRCAERHTDNAGGL